MEWSKVFNQWLWKVLSLSWWWNLLLSLAKTLPQEGKSEEHPLLLLAAPGLMTWLDVALFRAVEGQLVATLYSGHALLEAWIDLRQQAWILLRQLRQDLKNSTPVHETATTTSAAATVTHSTTAANARQQQQRQQWEEFARCCITASYDVIQKLGIDPLAESANLTDPYDPTWETGGPQAASSTASGGSSGHHHHHHHHQYSPVLSPNLLAAWPESASVLFTDRQRWPSPPQRRRDCWESPRLYCPDYVWADQVSANCQKWIRHLFHQGAALLDLSTFASSWLFHDPWLASASTHQQHQSQHPDGHSSSSGWDMAEQHVALLWQVVQNDLPVRLYQFRAAMEAESVTTKRLYLVKCEYRAPFRAFLEAHVQVRRAPTLAWVDEYLTLTGAQVEQRRGAAKDRLQKLLETPALIEVLALERQCEEYETAMAKALFPFCEMVRYLESRRARLKIIPGLISDVAALTSMQKLQRRLSGMLLALPPRRPSSASSQPQGHGSGGHSTGGGLTGIRPLLLDLCGVPHDDQDLADQDQDDEEEDRDMEGDMPVSPSLSEIDYYDEESAVRRLTELLAQLGTLGVLSSTKNAFRVEKKSDVNIPPALVRACTHDFDAELWTCHFQDWLAMVRRQRDLTSRHDLEELAEQIRQAEMQIGLSALASGQSLEVARQRLELMEADREKRFTVLKEMIEEVGLRELNLYTKLMEPDKRKALALPSMSALGVFGSALQMAGETLPIG